MTHAKLLKKKLKKEQNEFLLLSLLLFVYSFIFTVSHLYPNLFPFSILNTLLCTDRAIMFELERTLQCHA